MTYSIVARDGSSGQIGVAAQSHFFAAGGLVCWAEPGVGAVASQAFADSMYGSLGLELMGQGLAPSDALMALLRIDSLQQYRQVGLVDAAGASAAHTGEGCIPHAYHSSALGVTVQGNMLDDDRIVSSMLEAFESADGELADRLLAALFAGEEAGGDARGQQAAGIKVVSGAKPKRPWDGVLIDLRVEDHPQPLNELRRLVEYKRAFDLVASAIFAEGLMLGDFAEPYSGAVDETSEDLEKAADYLGSNAEPDLWRTILLARARRDDEARSAMNAALEKNPSLVRFFRRLPDAGFISADNPLLSELP